MGSDLVGLISLTPLACDYGRPCLCALYSFFWPVGSLRGLSRGCALKQKPGRDIIVWIQRLDRFTGQDQRCGSIHRRVEMI